MKKALHHGGKMGDLLLALPAIRAYARKYGPVDLITSALCVPLVPLLWECDYIWNVKVDASQTYEADGKILLQWDYFKNSDGINLSPQPSFREETAPYYYADCYSRLLEVIPQKEDYMIFPSLVNHRRWFDSHEVFYKGVSQKKRKTLIIAPECESVGMVSWKVWWDFIHALNHYFEILVIGTNDVFPMPESVTDLRGKTTVPAAALLIAESHALIGGHSFPMQLASRIEVPTFCLQEMVPTLDRANPINCNTVYLDPAAHASARDYYINQIRGNSCVSS